MSVRDKNKVLKIFFAFFFMSVLMGKGVSVHAEAPQYAYETKFVVDADNAKIQLTAIGNATGFEFETTYEEQNNVSITGWQYIGGKWYYYEELGTIWNKTGIWLRDERK